MNAASLSATHCLAFQTTRGWSAPEFENLLGQASVILCGDAKSFVLGRVIGNEAEVLTLATHPDFHRRGLANQMLNQFLDQAAAKGAKRVVLEVASDNEAAKSLYTNNNFEICGHRPKYYKDADGRWIDAVLMDLTLKNPKQT